MKFTEDDIKNKFNYFEIEEEGLQFYTNTLEKGDDTYYLIGDAIFDGEIYKNFKIEIKLLNDVKIEEPRKVINLDWEWYDFKFN